MKNKFFTGFISLLIILFYHHPAYCHKVMVFAWIDGKTVHTECKFSGGKKVIQGRIEVFDLKGKKLLDGITDNNGEFSFPLPGKFSFEVVLNASTGHKRKWTVPEDEIKEAFSSDNNKHEDKLSPTKYIEKKEEKNRAPVPTTAINYDELTLVVENAVDKKLKPVIKMLKESRNEPSFRDIIGGIGYITGLLGMAAYFNYRKKNK